jgi:methionyl-tRNA formyltransferase
MKIVLAASAEIAVPCIEALFEQGLLAALLTNPDSAKGRGRGGALTPTPAAHAAAACGLPPSGIVKAAAPDAHIVAELAALKPELLVSFAYGAIFTKEFLSLFPRGAVNIHPSLLPRHRGAVPIPAAILARETETGISIQRIVGRIDAGPILCQETIPLTLAETAGELSALVAARAPALLLQTLRAIDDGTVRERAQNEAEASHCRQLKKEDGLIDWTGSAAGIDAQVRAYTPWPLSHTRHDGRELYILAGRALSGAPEPSALPAGSVLGVDRDAGILIQTGDGVYCAAALQYKTKKALHWKAFLNGARGFTGSRLG